MLIIIKNVKGIKRCVIKRKIEFSYYVYCLFNDILVLQLHQRFNSEAHNVYTLEINKIALSSNVNKTLQIFDTITSVGKVCKTDQLEYVNIRSWLLCY